jgi:hypothetical protein
MLSEAEHPYASDEEELPLQRQGFLAALGMTIG